MSQTLPPAWIDPDADGATLELLEFPTLLLHQASHLLRQFRIRPLLARHGIGVPEYRTMALLAVYGQQSTAQIRERSSMDKAQASRTLQMLEKRGYTQREVLPGHEQRQWLSLTAEGVALFERVMGDMRELQLALLRALPAQERRSLHETLTRLAALAVADDAG